MRISDWSSDVCSSDLSLVLSDGTANLRFFDPATMTETKRVPVTLAGRPLRMLNELEAIDGELWANVWMTDAIVRIDPETGVVGSIVDLRGLRQDAGAAGYDSVLNGIAWDEKGKRLIVTGKYWPTRSEKHTSELQSLMRTSYAVFCSNKKKSQETSTTT